MNHLLGVYGTLRKGEGNHRLLRDSEFLGFHSTLPTYTMYSNGGFPYVTPSGTTSITLEIYRVTDPVILRDIYRLEGFSGTRNNSRNWYESMDVDTAFGPAEIFISEPKNLPIIDSGDWKSR